MKRAKLAMYRCRRMHVEGFTIIIDLRVRETYSSYVMGDSLTSRPTLTNFNLSMQCRGRIRRGCKQGCHSGRRHWHLHMHTLFEWFCFVFSRCCYHWQNLWYMILIKSGLGKWTLKAPSPLLFWNIIFSHLTRYMILSTTLQQHA